MKLSHLCMPALPGGIAACRGGVSGRAVSWPGSASGFAVWAAGRLEAADEGAEAGGEPFVAVVGPDVLAEGGQRGEAAGGQGAQECVQLASGHGVLDALLAGGGGVAEREAEGVVVDQPEGQGGLACGQPGRVQRGEERFD